MWILIARRQLSDATVWPGRRVLAAVDALAWPLAWVIVATHLPTPSGLVSPVVIAICVVAAVRRVWRAVLRNERYRFTTWRWGVPVLFLLVVGLLIKIALGV